jgi:hypothetical protein
VIHSILTLSQIALKINYFNGLDASDEGLPVEEHLEFVGHAVQATMSTNLPGV